MFVAETRFAHQPLTLTPDQRYPDNSRRSLPSSDLELTTWPIPAEQREIDGGETRSADTDLESAILVKNRVHGAREYLTGMTGDERKYAYSFDLSNEIRRVQEFGESHRQETIDNFLTFGKEAYLRGAAVEYHYRVDERKGGRRDGERRLLFPHVDIDALSSFSQAENKKGRPEWLRSRDRADARIIERIHDDMQLAPVGTVWIAMSPGMSPGSAPHGEMEEYGYHNGHSFALVHQLIRDKETGGLRLACRALRNYLPPAAQADFYTRMTGYEVSPENLHGSVAKLQSMPNEQFDIQNINDIVWLQRMGQEVASKPGGSFMVSDDDQTRRERAFDARVSDLKPMMYDIYEKILELGPKPSTSELDDLLQSVQICFGLMARAGRGEDILGTLHKLFPSREGHVMGAEFYDLRNLLAQEAQYFSSTCGFGIGFSQEAVGKYGLYGAISMSQNGYEAETTHRYESYRCPNCSKFIPGELKSVDSSEWTKVCPHCRKEIVGCAPGVQGDLLIYHN